MIKKLSQQQPFSSKISIFCIRKNTLPQVGLKALVAENEDKSATKWKIFEVKKFVFCSCLSRKKM